MEVSVSSSPVAVAGLQAEVEMAILAGSPSHLTPQILQGAVIYWFVYCSLMRRGDEFCNAVGGILLSSASVTVQNEFEAIRDLMLGAINQVKDARILSQGEKLGAVDIAQILANAVAYRHGKRDTDPSITEPVAAAFIATLDKLKAAIDS